MKALFPILIILAFGFSSLAGSCTPTFAPANIDLQDADAQATLGAVRVARQATQQAAEWETQTALQTAGAVDAELRLLAARGTATAQVMQGEMTATAAAYAMAGQMTAQAEQAEREATETARAWAQTQPALTATAQSISLMTKRESDTAMLRTWGGFGTLLALAMLFMVTGIVAARKVAPWVLLRFFGVQDWNGKPIVIVPTPGGGLAVVDYTRSIGPGTMLVDGQVRQSGAEEGLAQERTTARAQAAELMLAAQGAEPGMRKAAAKMGGMEQPQVTEIQPEQLPERVSFTMLDGWRGQALPLGMGAQGLITADPEAAPHLLVAGTTGSGKTRYGLRPVIASALAQGWQVAIFDRSGLDFLPFQDHPNAKLIKLGEAVEAVGYLRAMYLEILRRFELMMRSGVTTWSRMPFGDPHVLGVFDEFSNLADSLENAQRGELWRYARMVAAEGRKAGIHLAIALQDPTHRSLDLRIRRNMTPMVFRVRDGDSSRVVLNANGAETLPKGQFLAGLGLDLVRGVAFCPDDDEIDGFLGRRMVHELPEPTWLLETGEEVVVEEDERAERVREMFREGRSLNEIQREVYGYAGGKAYESVKKITEALKG
jgi:hypothetical protein